MKKLLNKKNLILWLISLIALILVGYCGFQFVSKLSPMNGQGDWSMQISFPPGGSYLEGLNLNNNGFYFCLAALIIVILITALIWLLIRRRKRK